MLISADSYHYSVIWSDEDDEYVGLCAEFPLLSWLDPEQDKALDGIKRVVDECLVDMIQNGEFIPKPIGESE